MWSFAAASYCAHPYKYLAHASLRSLWGPAISLILEVGLNLQVHMLLLCAMLQEPACLAAHLQQPIAPRAVVCRCHSQVAQDLCRLAVILHCRLQHIQDRATASIRYGGWWSVSCSVGVQMPRIGVFGVVMAPAFKRLRKLLRGNASGLRKERWPRRAESLLCCLGLTQRCCTAGTSWLSVLSYVAV
jgi:hypothetical protein